MITLTPNAAGEYMPDPFARLAAFCAYMDRRDPARPSADATGAPAKPQPPCSHGAKGSVCHDCGWLP